MTDTAKIVINLAGKALTFFNRQPIFQPLRGEEIFYRPISIITSPFIMAGYSIHYFLQAVEHLVEVIASLCTSDREKALTEFMYCENKLTRSGAFLVMVIISPIINLVDLLGGIVNTIRAEMMEASDEQTVQRSQSLI